VKSEDCRAVAEGEGGHVAPFDQRATYDKPAKNRMKFFYVYILQSETATETFYVGFTEDLRSRLKFTILARCHTPSNFGLGGLKQPVHSLTASAPLHLNAI